ncbi:MAG: hypothetical protein COA71_12965 [SAR86 cluster bacterium]|uniref:SnoaL-like domain-containing protein n=1 Tax=SAR86 cluster bacterium TaxID=2030880 RepID=A0A2A5C7K4_9GAMM|nr:hypothetical protein [Gammaproteobacteria bacterium AH-315-E17]PCJ39792.1 MAG: hypothetical protein COA71_12965 [SAR86 cluster bacterium]
MRNIILTGMITVASVAFVAYLPNAATAQAIEQITEEVLARHDYSLADSANKRTALAYLYTAWNDGQVQNARQTYWEPGSFPEAPTTAEGAPPPDLPTNIGSPQYTMKKVVEEGNHVVVLAFVEGVGIGDEITTIFGTSGGIKIGDAVVEIFEFNPDGLITNKWDTFQSLSEESYDFR